MFQFTRPQGARLLSSPCPLRVSVSIHAPTRGATSCSNTVTLPGFVSIHAPTRGATLCALSSAWQQSVSIHAPTRGATPRNPYVFRSVRFQFTRPQGARHQRSLINETDRLFQFTRPQGARQAVQ